MIRVLLTSFEPFGGHARNSSHEVARVLSRQLFQDAHLDWLPLPVVAWECVDRTWATIEQTDPEVVLLLGQAAGAAAIRLEDRAININDFPIPDNAGNLLRMQWIEPTGASWYRTTVRLEPIADEVRRAGIPVERSCYAGTYVCNHLYYGLLHRTALSGRSRQTAFVHLPLLHGQVRAGDRTPTRPLEQLVEGVQRVLRCCIESARPLRRVS
jgi:pyroglutamyl-peptidase